MNGRTIRIGSTAVRAASTLVLIAALAAPATAQEADSTAGGRGIMPNAGARANPQPIVVSYFRAHDSRGVNVFEAPKLEGVPYDGFKLQWGAAFTQQFQDLMHRNSAAPNVVSGMNLNNLIDVGPGVNNAGANLLVDALLARGVRAALATDVS